MIVPKKDFIKVFNKFNGNKKLIKQHLEDKFNTTLGPNYVYNTLKRLRKQGDMPLESGNKVGTGEVLKGTSTLYDSEGNIKVQWVKSNVEKENILKQFEEAVNNFVERVEPKTPTKLKMIKKSKEPGCDDIDDILVKIPIADSHIGLLTWHKEVGADFDLKIAEQLYSDAIERLVDKSPDAGTCLLLDLGDTIHTDDQSNQTKASKHQLDVDGRFDKQFDMVLIILTKMIDTALKKYKKVIFRKTRGNHDPDSSVAIGAFLEAYYRNEPRVTIERSPSLFWSYKFGKTLHFSTHGHTTKQKDLPEIVAHDCRDIWSECTAGVFIDTGHVHHQQIIETRTAVCESHNSLTAGDSYNYGHGYRSMRNMKSITYHKEDGEIGRDNVSLRMLNRMREGK